MRRFIILISLLLCSFGLFATHQRAGEITYEYVSGLTYRFTILTYTYTPSAADRPELDIVWGDGTSSTVDRVWRIQMENDITRNVYIAEHTFPSTGTFHITLEDPNRNNGIVNIPNSVNVPFFLETILTINPFIGSNSSPQLLNPPIDNGCLGYPYYHNPGAYDADGDSLSYSLITCRGYDGEDIPGYALPAASNSISIDPVTGDLLWDSPVQQGEYNIAILIREWRNGICIGSVVRDMQITILSCQNQPPVITTIDDTCVVAGTELVFDVIGDDPNSTSVALTATGGVFNFASNHATFATAAGPPPVTGHFWWQTTCSHVRRSPYSVLFKVTDNGPQVNLTAYKTVNITVVAPKPDILSAIPIGNTIEVAWAPHTCANVKGYRVYRRVGSSDFEPDHCETGLPASAGYQLIGTLPGHDDTLFVDDGSVLPLNHGNEYCYRVVAYFADGAESYVSDEVCAVLHNDVPRLTHVDVDATDVEAGRIIVRWLRPTELDTLQFPGPAYEYRVSRADGNGPFTQIRTFYSLDDTTFDDNGLNTEAMAYTYQIDLYAEVNGEMVEVGSSDAASSVWLNITPLDRSLRLEWHETVPWTNTEYVIYRLNDDLHQFDSLGVTTSSAYLDENLENGHIYSYYVESRGSYFAPDTVGVFRNRSQIKNAVPADITPPKVPAITVTTDCETVDLAWTFSSDSAHFDVYRYYIHYRQNYATPAVIIDSFELDDDCYPSACTYRLENLPFITGCFSLSSVDTAGNHAAPTEEVCFDVDACSPYRLPNIITPNGDGANDEMIPFPYDNVEGVDFYIYNRWGRLVFKTTDPDIHWDGKDIYSHQPSSDGTYYYVCYVRLYTLVGVVTQELHGTVTVIR